MAKTTIVWFRNDLRLNDNSALTSTLTSDAVIPLFILDERIYRGSRSSGNRNRFLLESLSDLRASLRKRGSDLIIRSGDTQTILAGLCREQGVTEVACSADYSPYAHRRDATLESELQKISVSLKRLPGRATIDDPTALRTKAGAIYKVFTPFYNNWLTQPRRQLLTPSSLPHLPTGIDPGVIPVLLKPVDPNEVSPKASRGGASSAQKRLESYLSSSLESYVSAQNDLGADATSRLSPYLHFGCISPREIESVLPDTKGGVAFRRQLAWRDFYLYILYHFPRTVDQEFQERYRTLEWATNEPFLNAWKNGTTGYPVVDAAMRQLKAEGWMHNRARLIVGSFLTKDLGIDWREGEKHFMHWLLDGDTAQNVGNWQWIASTGVDPAPLFRRLYNPVSQQKTYDPRGAYVRRYVPELATVPDEHIAEPWRMTRQQQSEAKCVIGVDYPAPIVDHKIARQTALQRYRQLI